MIKLYLFRHAKSSWKADVTDDFHRPLNDRGRAAAPFMGTYMHDAAVAPDLILCSAAIRARETLALILPFLAEDTVIRIEHALYLADKASLIARVQALEATDAAVMIIGHNPGMQDLALSLAASDDTARHDALSQKFPTAALAELVFDVADWTAVAPKTGTLARFETPRSVRSASTR